MSLHNSSRKPNDCTDWPLHSCTKSMTVKWVLEYLGAENGIAWFKLTISVSEREIVDNSYAMSHDAVLMDISFFLFLKNEELW